MKNVVLDAIDKVKPDDKANKDSAVIFFISEIIVECAGHFVRQGVRAGKLFGQSEKPGVVW